MNTKKQTIPPVVQHKPFINKELHSKHLSVDLKKTKSFNFQRNLKLKQPKKKNCFSSKTLLFVTDSQKTLFLCALLLGKNYFCFDFTPTKKQTIQVLANNLPVSEQSLFEPVQP